MQAGKLRQRVTIQSPVDATNGYGEVVRTWALVATVWASVVYLSGREYLQARQLESETTVRITIRHRESVTERCRVLWDGHTFDIESVIPDPTNARQMQLMCQEAA